MERGAPQLLKRSVPLHARGVEFGVDGWRQIAEAAVCSDSVVVLLPGCQLRTSLGQRAEQCLVEKFGLMYQTHHGGVGDEAGWRARGVGGTRWHGSRR
jgi:hypothetical protein